MLASWLQRHCCRCYLLLAFFGLTEIGSYKFKQVITAFPDSCSVMSKLADTKRNGSIGINLLKRFVVLFDYQQGHLYLKPNYNFKQPFEHDMSGTEYYAAE